MPATSSLANGYSGLSKFTAQLALFPYRVAQKTLLSSQAQQNYNETRRSNEDPSLDFALQLMAFEKARKYSILYPFNPNPYFTSSDNGHFCYCIDY